MLEAAIGTGILASLSVFVVSLTVASFANTTFAAYSCIADNYLANQVAYIEAADIAPDGALTMPALNTNSYFMATGYPLNATNTKSGVPIFRGSTNYSATVRTSRTPATDPLGAGVAQQKGMYVYTVQVNFTYPGGNGGGNTAIGVTNRTYSRSRSVVRYAEQ